MILRIQVTKFGLGENKEVMAFDLPNGIDSKGALSKRAKDGVNAALSYLALNPEVVTVTMTYTRG